MEKTVREDCADLLYQHATTNGAPAFSSTGDKCLDLFFIAGAMRGHDLERINMKFTEAYRENPELAMKLLFYIRDIRGGIGERDVFRRLIRTVAKKWPESAVKNVRWITEYGRWDDLICLFGTRAEKEAVRMIREQLDSDMAALERRRQGELNAHISLCAKWMPSSNASSARTRGNAKVLMRLLNLNEKQYRSILTPLRAAISLTEHYVSRREYDRINYDHVPSQALLRYDRLFTEYDNERYETFMRGIRGGCRRMNAATLTPDQITGRTAGFGFGMLCYNEGQGGREARLALHRGGSIIHEKSGRRFSWGRLQPIHISYRPNSNGHGTIFPFREDAAHHSRKWRAKFYRERRQLELTPVRRYEYIGEYDEEKPQDWKHPFDPFGDPRYVSVYLGSHYGSRKGFNDQKLYLCYAIARICGRCAGTKHEFREAQAQRSYRMSHPEEFWKSLPGTVGMKNAISVIDTSASMMAYGAHSLADALGLFYAEHAKGAFHNKFITFSEKPKLMKVRGEKLAWKLMNIHNASWGGTTNLEKVYNMLLRMAIRAGSGQDEMPSAVVIYSDMEFNRSVTNPDENLFAACRKAFEEAGYEMPAIVFHNVNSLQMQAPLLSDTRGSILSSGRTTHHMKHKHQHSATPLLHMLDVLMSERYAPIHA